MIEPLCVERTATRYDAFRCFDTTAECNGRMDNEPTYLLFSYIDRDCKNTWFLLILMRYLFSLLRSPRKSSTTHLATHVSANENRRNYHADLMGLIAYNLYPRDATLTRILAMARCLSVSVSVTSQSSSELTGRIELILGVETSFDQSWRNSGIYKK